jgi:hypothetical protein
VSCLWAHRVVGAGFISEVGRSPNQRIPGIVLSAYDMQEDARKSLIAGFGERPAKPIDTTQVDRAVNRIAAIQPLRVRDTWGGFASRGAAQANSQGRKAAGGRRPTPKPSRGDSGAPMRPACSIAASASFRGLPGASRLFQGLATLAIC